MTFSSPVLPTGAVNYGTGEEILLSITSNLLTFMTKLSISSGVPMSQLFLLQSAKMEDLSSGINLFIQGFGEEKHVGPNLHSQR